MIAYRFQKTANTFWSFIRIILSFRKWGEAALAKIGRVYFRRRVVFNSGNADELIRQRSIGPSSERRPRQPAKI